MSSLTPQIHWKNCKNGHIDTGDTAWMLFATTFVMLMTVQTKQIEIYKHLYLIIF
jgi:hypothetical protein